MALDHLLAQMSAGHQEHSVNAVHPAMKLSASVLGASGMALLGSIILTAAYFSTFTSSKSAWMRDCRIQGSAKVAQAEPYALVIVLLRKVDGAGDAPPTWKIVDHFVLDRPGPWVFATTGSGNERFASRRL